MVITLLSPFLVILTLSVVSAIPSPMHMEMLMMIIALQLLSVILMLRVVLAIPSPMHMRMLTVRAQPLPTHVTLMLLVVLAIPSPVHMRTLMVSMLRWSPPRRCRHSGQLSSNALRHHRLHQTRTQPTPTPS